MIGHLDADCFYVSCERVRFPELCRKPVGVLGNQGACVIAKSYEMKATGVRTGMPIWEALPCCPQGIYVKRDFRWYEVLSRLILGVLHEVSPTVEYYSIDEMFFDADELPHVFGQPLPEAAQSLQQRILQETGIPASIGISFSKTLAKLASDAGKPFGCLVLRDRPVIVRFLETQPVTEMAGIAERSRRKLAEDGIASCLDFAQTDRQRIRNLLTIKGEALWWELHGEPVQPLLTERPPHKCLSRGGSLGEATADPEHLKAWIARNAERLVEELDYHQVAAGRLSLSLEFKPSGGWCGQVRFAEPVASFEPLVSAANRLLVDAPRADVSGMHLIAESLCLRDCLQRTLFTSSAQERTLDDLKRQVNGKVGRFALRSGQTLFLPGIYADDANEYDICDVHGKMCF